MNSGRTTLSFLDLALMLLSAFAYTHFVNIADEETRKKLDALNVQVVAPLGLYEYKSADLFGSSNAMLSDFARKEIADILTVQQKQLLTIYVPPIVEKRGEQRLRQWEKVAARSAAIADAFERAGQDGKMIILKMPDKLISETGQKQAISFTFLPVEKPETEK